MISWHVLTWVPRSGTHQYWGKGTADGAKFLTSSLIKNLKVCRLSHQHLLARSKNLFLLFISSDFTGSVLQMLSNYKMFLFWCCGCVYGTLISIHPHRSHDPSWYIVVALLRSKVAMNNACQERFAPRCACWWAEHQGWASGVTHMIQWWKMKLNEKKGMNYINRIFDSCILMILGGFTYTKPPFQIRSAEVAINCPNGCHRTL